jgi:hypothetical protein
MKRTHLIDGLVGVRVEHGACPLRTDRVDFVDENNARRARLGGPEEVAYPTGSLADQNFVKFGTGSVEKRNSGLAGDGPGEKGFAGARRSDEKAALGQFSTEGAEFFLQIKRKELLPKSSI